MSDDPDNITPFPGTLSEGGEKSDVVFSNGLETGAGSIETESEPSPRPASRSRLRRLHAVLAGSRYASAAIARKDAVAALRIEGVETVIFAEDLGREENALAREYKNEPLLVRDEASYPGQPVAIVVGHDLEACRKARDLIRVDYHPSPGIFTLEHALAMKSYHGEAKKVARGDASAAIDSAEKRLKGSLLIGPQRPCTGKPPQIEVSWGHRGEDVLEVIAPTRDPAGLRTAVARAAAMPESAVVVHCPPFTGSFEAMELEPLRLAVLATHAAKITGANVSLQVDQDSPLFRGQRHAARASFEAGFGSDGVVHAADIRLALDGGYFASDSDAVLDRALLHADGTYAIANFRARAVLCKTNTVVSSAMPAEGAAQGTWIIEELMQRVADDLGMPVHEVKEINFYNEVSGVRSIPCGQSINPEAVSRVWGHVLNRSDYYDRFQEIQDWNDRHANSKRGISICPIRFGLGDPRQEKNRATVLVQILPDGSIEVRPGVVDFQDGIAGQIREEVSVRFGVLEETVRVLPGDFQAIAESAPTLGADTAGLILRALADGTEQLLDHLRQVAQQLFAARGENGIELEAISFANGQVGSRVGGIEPLTFAELIEGALHKRANLTAVGFHRPPNLWWDRNLGEGWPFSSFTYAAAVAEVTIDMFTGEVEVLRVDIAHEGSPTIHQGDRDAAQLVRAFSLGTGWVLTESTPPEDASAEESFRPEECISGFSGAPLEFFSDRLRPATALSEAPGDPCAEAPVLLAASVRYAVWNALQEFAGATQLEIDLPFPATPPALIAALTEIRQRQVESPSETSMEEPDESGGGEASQFRA